MRQSKISVAVFGVFMLATLVTAFYLAGPVFSPSFSGDSMALEYMAYPVQQVEPALLPAFESQADVALAMPLQLFDLSVKEFVQPVVISEGSTGAEAAAALEAASQAQVQVSSELQVSGHLGCHRFP